MLKLTLEVGHVAQRKQKIEKGFTHDWELFVRSPVRNPEGDLSLFVEKVVFNLHNTFVKPKRTVKSQPFVIKESGYAAFEVFIEVYLKNREENRKFTFSYDLDLQPFKSELKEIIIEGPISDEFRRKCIKGGGCIQANPQQKDTSASSLSSYKSGAIYTEVKKPSKNTTSAFLDLFGAPIEKSQLPSKIPNKADKNVQPPTTNPNSSSMIAPSSSTKEKNEKSKHKSQTSDSKDSKKSTDTSRSEKVKKDKQKDRDRSDKKEKSSKRSSSPSNKSGVPNNTSAASLSKIQAPIVDTTTNSSSSGNKTKKNEREKSEKKEHLKSSKEKPHESSLSLKERDMLMLNKTNERQKQGKSESKNVIPPGESSKKHSSSVTDLERKHKHKKKEKCKEKESRSEKEHKNSKSKTSIAIKVKSHFSDKESNSDSEKNEKEVTPEKRKKSSREEKGSTTKVSTEKDDKQSKRKLPKDDRDSSASPPLPKQSKKEFLPATVFERNLPDSHSSNNNHNPYTSSDIKVSNDYLDELKDLKHKINLLQTKELHHVVRLIASTGFYEITKSSFNFDLVQLNLVQPGIISQLIKLVAGNIDTK